MKQVKVGILGATSYTGVELVKLLRKHSCASVAFVTSQSYEGKRMSEVFPEMLGICDATLTSPEKALAIGADCVFSCMPHAVSATTCLPFITAGTRMVDLSADFRIRDLASYTAWYKVEHPCPQYVRSAVFGLPEHYRTQIATASIVANPGCYPTSIMLPLLPLLKNPGTLVAAIIADSKSGVSGAGRSLKLTSHYVEVNENFSAYSIGRKHRHLAEIDQELSAAAGRDIKITFTPHLVPATRGILSTVYFQTNRTAQECLDIVKKAYAAEPFVRVRGPDDLPCLKGVVHSNYCDITFAGGGDGQPVIAVSAIDNLVKGASGQALQNMNIMFGLDEQDGLR